MKGAVIIDRIQKAIVLFLLVAGSFIFLLPFYLMLSMSLKSSSELSLTSIWAWPKQVTFDNYVTVLTNPNVNFGMFFQNTVVIAIFSTIGVVLTSAMVAFPFARMRFRGRDRLFILVLSTMMLPGIVTLIPSFVLYKELGWVNTVLPLTVPAFFGGGAFNIFLLRQFFMTIPRDLDEAAILDGASYWTIFTKVILPLSGPSLATVGIFCFVYNWRDFLFPLIILNEPSKQTLEVGLSTYNSLRNAEWHLLMAGSTLVSIPLIIIFFVGQRYFVKGIVMSGMK
jgi:multiple sugar transport system permease protein